MEKIVFYLLVFVLIFSCQYEDTGRKACGFENPTEEIDWLKELIAKADEDTTGLYKGSIYLEQYENNDVFWIEMAMNSGGVMGYWFDCEGKPVEFIHDSMIPKRKILIYINIP